MCTTKQAGNSDLRLSLGRLIKRSEEVEPVAVAVLELCIIKQTV